LEGDSVRFFTEVVLVVPVKLLGDVEEDDSVEEDEDEVGVETSSFPVLKKSCKLLI
jgi:hypothetical protein